MMLTLQANVNKPKLSKNPLAVPEQILLMLEGHNINFN